MDKLTGPLVLVVDDDRFAARLLESVLVYAGYAVRVAADGAQALALLRGGLMPSLIMLDLHMPGMDGAGFRALQLSIPEYAAIPVLVCSGSGGEILGTALGGLPVLPKPSSIDEILGAVAAVLAR